MPGVNITAKAKLGSKVQLSNGDWTLSFYPDYYGDKAEQNKAWATSTPSLMYQMNVRNDVAQKFEAGKSYTVTFTPEEEVTEDGGDSAS